jgi:hypothetical protein
MHILQNFQINLLTLFNNFCVAESLEINEIYAGNAGFIGSRHKTALRKTSINRHLASLEPLHLASAGASFAALMTVGAGFSAAGAYAAADCFFIYSVASLKIAQSEITHLHHQFLPDEKLFL